MSARNLDPKLYVYVVFLPDFWRSLWGGQILYKRGGAYKIPAAEGFKIYPPPP